VGSDQRVVEDPPEGLAEQLAGPGDVVADRRRIGDDLVLKPGIELHVSDLVDELGREEAALLLVVLGQDQPAELGRDPLFGDHQGAEDEEEELPLRLIDGRPLLQVGG
jgi:hypothetical protein